jgi:hypothetical protein
MKASNANSAPALISAIQISCNARLAFGCLIWIFSDGDDGVMALTDFGIENLMELIRIHKENPELLKR